MEKWTKRWQDSRGISWELEFEEAEEDGLLNLICDGYPTKNGKRGVKGCSMDVSPRRNFRAIPADYGFIDGVDVHHCYRGAGLGTWLVAYAIEWLKSKGLKGCGGYLKQGGDMGARVRFFKRLGFEVSPNTTIIKLPFE